MMMKARVEAVPGADPNAYVGLAVTVQGRRIGTVTEVGFEHTWAGDWAVLTITTDEEAQ